MSQAQRLSLDTSTEEELTDNYDSGVSLSKEMDELLYTLDAIGDRANDSMQAAADSELLWLQTLQERDELILSNNESLKQLQKLNTVIREENEYLKTQLSHIAEPDAADPGQRDDLDSAPQTPIENGHDGYETESLAQLEKEQKHITKQLASSSNVSQEILRNVQQQQARYQQKLATLREELELQIGLDNSEEAWATRSKLSQLCDIYEGIIDSTCRECENFLVDTDDDIWTKSDEVKAGFKPRTADNQLPTNQPMPTRFPRSKPLHSNRPDDQKSDSLYLGNSSFRLYNLERINSQLREEIKNLQLELSEEERAAKREAAIKEDERKQRYTDDLKSRVITLTQQMTNLNRDNQALSERLLRFESQKIVQTSHGRHTDDLENEIEVLEENLRKQQMINVAKDHQIKQLELIKEEHTTLCETTKEEYKEAKRQIASQQTEIHHLSKKVKDARDLQKQFQEMNAGLNKQLEALHNENQKLHKKVHDDQKKGRCISRPTSSSQKPKPEMKAMDDDERTELVNSLQELLTRLENAEKQKENANKKVQALRDRLKGMHDSWETISKDTEASYTSLRQQYQQQISEYRTIIDSLKFQNTSLNTRIESLSKVKSVTEQYGTIDRVSSLEKQLEESLKLSDEYKVENLKLHQLLKSVSTAPSTVITNETFPSSSKLQGLPESDEFHKLREILNSAKSDVESMQLKQTQHSPFGEVKEQTEQAGRHEVEAILRSEAYRKQLERSETKRNLTRRTSNDSITFNPHSSSSPIVLDRNLQTTLEDIRSQNRREQILNSARSAIKESSSLSWRPRKYDSTQKNSPNRMKQVIEVTAKSEHYPELDPNKTFKPIENLSTPTTQPRHSERERTYQYSSKYLSSESIRLPATDSGYESPQKARSYPNPKLKYYTPSSDGYTSAYKSSYKPYSSLIYKSTLSQEEGVGIRRGQSQNLELSRHNLRRQVDLSFHRAPCRQTVYRGRVSYQPIVA